MIFSDSPQQRAMERMMTAVPRFRPKGGGIMVLHHFEYTAEMMVRCMSSARMIWPGAMILRTAESTISGGESPRRCLCNISMNCFEPIDNACLFE